MKYELRIISREKIKKWAGEKMMKLIFRPEVVREL
jgi:hypothetical protein